MGIVFGCVVPHPPLLLPDVGHGQEKAIQATIDALNRLAGELAEAGPETLLVISPHGEGHGDAMGVLTGARCTGDMRQWGSSSPTATYSNDLDLVSALQHEAEAAHIALKSIGDKGYQLDHGVMAPMHYLGEKVKGLPLVPMTFSFLPLPSHFALGQALRIAAEKSGKRVAIIASGDLSHRLTPSAPSGYDPQGQVFDQEVVRAVREG
ncbi:MAG: class III extradiol dioxygenase subunit B-like domain-containing protein, partial [Dehalococcoidia bacterium]